MSFFMSAIILKYFLLQ